MGLYLFFDSVRFTAGHHGLFSGAVGRREGGGGLGQTTSMGIVMAPLFIGIVALFFDARKTWAWVVLWLGLAVLLVEIVSRVRIYIDSKLTHVILIMIMMGDGVGLMLRAYLEDRLP